MCMYMLQSWTKVFGTLLHFWGIFQCTQVPSPHPTNNVGQLYPECFSSFNFVYGWGRKNCKKWCIVLRGNWEMTEKYDYCSSVPSWGLLSRIVALEWKERALIEKVISRYFWWFLEAILVYQNCTPMWCLHIKLYKSVQNIATNDSETVVYKDLTNCLYISLLYHFIFLASSTGQFCLIVWENYLSKALLRSG